MFTMFETGNDWPKNRLFGFVLFACNFISSFSRSNHARPICYLFAGKKSPPPNEKPDSTLKEQSFGLREFSFQKFYKKCLICSSLSEATNANKHAT